MLGLSVPTRTSAMGSGDAIHAQFGRARGRFGAGTLVSADFASGDGQVSVVSSKMLDGVFCFGGREEESLQRAANAKNAEDPQTQVLGMLKAADAYIEANKLKESASEVNEALKLITEHQFEEGRACVLVIIAKIYAKQGTLSSADQLDEALDFAMEAQEKFQRYKCTKCEAASLVALAMVRYALRRFDEGHEAIKEARELFDDQTDHVALASIHVAAADGYLLAEEEQRAASMIMKAKKIKSDLRDVRGEAECVHKHGLVQIQAHRRGKCNANAVIDVLTEARRIFASVSDPIGETDVLKTQRDFQVRTGKIIEAIQTGQQIVTVFHDAENVRGESQALLDLGFVLLDQKQMALAEKVLRAAHQVALKCRDNDIMAKVGELYTRVKNESLKTEIQDSIEKHGGLAHYPVNPVVDFALSRTASNALSQLAAEGL